MRSQGPTGRWTPILASLVLSETLVLAWLAQIEPLPVPKLLLGYGLAFAAYVALVLLIKRVRTHLWVWFVAALVLRLPWLSAPPSLSDDAWRYLHDGRAQVAGVNPFLHPPAAPESNAYSGPERGLINNPDLPTVYPPAAQIVFLLAMAISASLLSWKLVLLLFDLGIGAAVALLLHSRRRPTSHAAIYLLHPLAVIEFAGNGHVDAVAIFLLMLSLALLQRERLAAGATIALSVAAKYLAAPLIPFFARATAAPWKLVAIALTTLAAVYLPYVGAPPLGSLGIFARTFEFNGSLFWLLAPLGAVPSRAILGALLLAGLAWAWRARWPTDSVTFWWIAAVLLGSPIVHPWYVAWLIPFLAWRDEWWALVWTGTVMISYAVMTEWRAEGVWTLPTWAAVVEYVPVYGALVIRCVGCRVSGGGCRVPGV